MLKSNLIEKYKLLKVKIFKEKQVVINMLRLWRGGGDKWVLIRKIESENTDCTGSRQLVS